MTTTGNAGGSHNLLVKPGQHDPAGLIKQMDRGLLVTELARPWRQLYVTGTTPAARRLLGRGTAHPVPGARDHHRRQPQRDVDGHREIGSDVLVRGSKHCGSISSSG